MQIVRATDAKTWVASFQRVNLNPRTRDDFPVLFKKIAGFLRAGKSFKKENFTPSAKDKFALLPTFWHSITPANRKVVMTVVQNHGFHYTAACVLMLRFECRLPYALMNDVCVCVIVSREHPESIDFEFVSVASAASDGVTPQAVVDIYAEKKSVNDNLKQFMLMPKDKAGDPTLKGNALFDHMCIFRNLQHASAKGKGTDEDAMTVMCPITHLAVHLYPDSLKKIQPTANQLRRGAIIKDYVGNNAARKCARRKLNSYGDLVGHCGVVNSKENMNRIKEQLVMADFVSEIHRKEAEDKVLEKLEKDKLNYEKAPVAVAVRKLEDKGHKVVKITVAEIELILFSVYNITMDGVKLRKADYVSALEKEMATNIIKLESFVRNLETVPASEGTVRVCGDSCAESVDA